MTDLARASLSADLTAAQARLGARIESKEEKRAQQNARVTRHREHHVALERGGFAARFVKQGWAERAKKLFVQEVEVGDKRFDDAVYIATDAPDAVRAFLQHERVREALVALVQWDCVIDVTSTELVVSVDDAIARSEDEAAEALALYAFLAGKT